MDIYTHRKEGVVVFVEGCQVKGQLGKWNPGVIYRRVKGDVKNISEFKGKVEIETEYRVMLLRAWKQNVKRIGSAYLGNDATKKEKEGYTKVLGTDKIDTRTPEEIEKEMKAHMEEVARKEKEDRENAKTSPIPDEIF